MQISKTDSPRCFRDIVRRAREIIPKWPSRLTEDFFMIYLKSILIRFDVVTIYDSSMIVICFMSSIADVSRARFATVASTVTRLGPRGGVMLIRDVNHHCACLAAISNTRVCLRTIGIPFSARQRTHYSNCIIDLNTFFYVIPTRGSPTLDVIYHYRVFVITNIRIACHNDHLIK